LAHEQDDLDGRSIPMSGVLALLTTFGMLLAYFKFSDYFRDWNDAAKTVFVCAALVCGLWGVLQFVVVYGVKPGESGFARRSRHRRHFPRPGVIYLCIMGVLFIGAVIGESNMLILVFALMAGPFVLNGWATFSMLKRMRVKRQVPARVMAGETVSVDIALENHKVAISSWMVTVRDRIANARESLDANILFARVPRRGQRNGHYQLRLSQRGVYRFGPILLSTRFPFGLVERGYLFDEPGEILVLPRVGRLSPSWKRNHLVGTELSQREQARRGAFDDEFHRIREFRSGDNPRAIHWRTSARHNELMVCEYHPSRDRDLLLLVDLWQPDRPNDVELDRVELAVSLAATICVEHVRQNRDASISLMVAGDRVSSKDALSGPGSIEPLLEVLATVAAGHGAFSRRLVDSQNIRRSSTTRTILVTTRSRADASLNESTFSTNGNGEPASLAGMQIIEARHKNLEPFFSLE
jgi:uncharacterized protein (DUF58 family)